MSVDERLGKIKSLLESREEIEIAYVFGSTVSGHGWKKIPDIDIAIFINCDKITFAEEVAEILLGKGKYNG